jgi:TonB family protein
MGKRVHFLTYVLALQLSIPLCIALQPPESGETKASGVSSVSNAEKVILPSGKEVYRVGGDVKAPEVLKQIQPQYTQEARMARIEGYVLFEAVAGKDGKVYNFALKRGRGYGLDERAIETVTEKWKVKPGILNGRPVNVRIQIECSFRMY